MEDTRTTVLGWRVVKVKAEERTKTEIYVGAAPT
jgi:hypothetical protein